jgi:hypothetical protein
VSFLSDFVVIWGQIPWIFPIGSDDITIERKDAAGRAMEAPPAVSVYEAGAVRKRLITRRLRFHFPAVCR